MKRICTSVISVILVVIMIVSSVSAVSPQTFPWYFYLPEHMKKVVEINYPWMDSWFVGENESHWYTHTDNIINFIYDLDIPESDAVEFARGVWAGYWFQVVATLDDDIPSDFYQLYYKSFRRPATKGLPLEANGVRVDLDVYKGLPSESGNETILLQTSWACIGEQQPFGAKQPCVMITDNETGKMLGIEAYNMPEEDCVYNFTCEIPSYFDQNKHTMYIAVCGRYYHGYYYDPPRTWGGTFYAVTEIDVSSLSEPPVPEPPVSSETEPVEPPVSSETEPVEPPVSSETEPVEPPVSSEIITPEPPVPDIVRGDADGSGALNLLDVTLTLKYLAEWEGITLDEIATDISGNGDVTLSDVSLMLQIIAGWNV